MKDADLVVSLTQFGLHVEAMLQPKRFKTGKNGFFKQGVVSVDGKKYRINMMAYEDKKGK